jgi:hypothetical protein
LIPCFDPGLSPSFAASFTLLSSSLHYFDAILPSSPLFGAFLPFLLPFILLPSFSPFLRVIVTSPFPPFLHSPSSLPASVCVAVFPSLLPYVLASCRLSYLSFFPIFLPPPSPPPPLFLFLPSFHFFCSGDSLRIHDHPKR